jgi:glycosyltransferase involved in cell wall biosynthesis
VASLKELLRPYYLRWVYFRAFPGARPAAFGNCWRYPFRALGEAGPPLLAPAAPGLPDIVWYPMTDWHARMQRTQQMARALAAMGRRSVYLNPHLGREFESTPLGGRRPRVALLEPNVAELHVGLPLEPVFHHRMLGAGESRVLAVAVEALLGEMGTARAVQILSLPIWLDTALELRRRRGFPVVYDCHDLLSGFPNMAREIVDAEPRVFAEADRVVFSSQYLMDLHPEVRDKAVLVRNGVDTRAFAGVHQKCGTNPKVAGYVGAIEEWFDVAGVREAALANPECRFILAGRVDYPPALSLKELPNVEMPGEVAGERVPELLGLFDIGIIPFIINSLTKATDPIKLYEYFACGLPVASSRLPEIEHHKDLVYTADRFADAVRQALAESDPERRERRREVARRSGWAERARELVQGIDQAPF